MTQRSNPRKFATQVLGSLKKQHGSTVQVYKAGTETVNWQDGTRSSTETCIEVDNCIVLPVKVTPEVVQTISYISVNKPAIQGGYFGAGKRNFIFDFAERRGLPSNYVWDLSDWIIIDDPETGVLHKYDVEHFEELHLGAGWLVTGTRVQGVVPQRQVKQNITHTLQLRLNHVVEVTVE